MYKYKLKYMETVMSNNVCWLGRLLRDEDGATATEYAVMLVMILLVALATIVFLGDKVEDAFNEFATLFSNAMG